MKEHRKFKKSIQNSIELAANENLIIFGIVPTYPATGYGYIQSEKILKANDFRTNKVERFIEKPDLENAKVLFKDKNILGTVECLYLEQQLLLEELKKFNPEIFQNCKQCIQKSKLDLDFLRLDESSFSKCPDISIDIAVFEKTEKAHVLPMDCGWNDIGNWQSLWEISKKDVCGNSIKGNVLVRDTKNSFIRSEEKLLVSLGLSNILIIDTKDALLVANKNCSQEIKNIVFNSK